VWKSILESKHSGRQAKELEIDFKIWLAWLGFSLTKVSLENSFEEEGKNL
jgi:hypothetical protein